MHTTLHPFLFHYTSALTPQRWSPPFVILVAWVIANKSFGSVTDSPLNHIKGDATEAFPTPGEITIHNRALHVYLSQVQYWFTWKANSFHDKIANINKRNVLRWKSNMALSRMKNKILFSIVKSWWYTHTRQSAWEGSEKSELAKEQKIFQKRQAREAQRNRRVDMRQTFLLLPFIELTSTTTFLFHEKRA